MLAPWLPAAAPPPPGEALSFCHSVMGRLGAESTAIFMIFGTPDP